MTDTVVETNATAEATPTADDGGKDTDVTESGEMLNVIDKPLRTKRQTKDEVILSVGTPVLTSMKNMRVS
ncbi:hypothetical protein DVH05_009893 [Phytophthora capsici]|nr:hypothetical protein DVH05_009893 [Phytophthora capsici]